MIVLSNSTAQTIAAGQTVTFDTVSLHTGNAECHRKGSSLVRLRCNGLYEVNFSGNVTGIVAGPVQLSISIDSTALPDGTMISTPAAVGDVNNIAKTTLISNCCGGGTITIQNNGTESVVLSAGSTLYIARKA